MSAFYTLLTSGALLGFLGVAFGAFGAHFLKVRLSSNSLDIFELGVRYQMYHALTLIVVALLLHNLPSAWFITAGAFFLAGTFVFSGSLYLIALTGVRSWGAVTPIGGAFLLIGWLTLFLGGLFSRYPS